MQSFNPKEMRKAGTFNTDQAPAKSYMKSCEKKQGLDGGSTAGPYNEVHAGGKPSKRGNTTEGLSTAYDMSLQKVYPKSKS